MEEIQTLIKELERERTNLKKLIDEAVKNGEYLIAHFHSEEMGYVNKRLQTVRNLDDKAFDRREFLKSMIKRSEIQLKADYPEELEEYFDEEIQTLKRELHELNQKEKVSASESLILVGHLDSLLSRKIRGVKLVLKRSSNFVLDIRSHRLGIMFQIPNLRSLKRNFIIHEENIQHFFGLGFTTDKSDTKLKLLLTNRDKECLLTELRTIISKLVFEIFYFKEFEGETFIEIYKHHHE